MNKIELKEYIAEAYHTYPDFPWAKYPDYMVFRHTRNKKWFALCMTVPKEKLGLPGMEYLELLNVKCDPVTLGSFREKPGIYPAYHMNKAHWISVALDGTVSAETVKLLLDISFKLTV